MLNSLKSLLILNLIVILPSYALEQVHHHAQHVPVWQSSLIGGLAGAAEVALPGQALSYWMNMRIKGQPFVLANSYRGFAVNALCEFPSSALEKIIKDQGSELVANYQLAPLNNIQKTGLSFAAGMAGALIDTPSNAVQIYLQDAANLKKNSFQAIRALGNHLYRGFVPNSFLKEAPFAVGYQVLAPQGQAAVRPYVGNDLEANILGGALAGVTTAVITQPGSVLRNKMQNEWAALQPKTFMQTIRSVYAQNGLKGFFKGLPQRGIRTALSVYLYATYSQKLEALFNE